MTNENTASTGGSAMRCGKPETVDCTDCGWQGTWDQTDAMLCPECGAECEEYDAEKDSPNVEAIHPEPKP